MTGCGCNSSLIGGRKRRQIGKRTRKNKRGGGWLDDLKSRFMSSNTNGNTSDPYASGSSTYTSDPYPSEQKTSWWENLTNRIMPSKEKSSDSSYSYPSYSYSNPSGGNKSRRHKGRRGGSLGCSMYKNKSKKNGRSTRSRK